MPLINNPATAMSSAPGGPLLHPHQHTLLAAILETYREHHGHFYLSRTLGGTTYFHSSAREQVPCEYADIIALEREGMIYAVGMNEHGITSFAPTALAAALVYPDDYLNLSDEAWSIARGTLRNSPERIRDVQGILRRLSDDPDSSAAIKDTAQAAHVLLGHVERYIDTGDPSDETDARTAAATLRTLAIMILRQSPAYGPLAIEMATKVLEAFGR